MVLGPVARCLKPCRYGKSLLLTKSRRSSPVRALLWSILPSLVFGRRPGFPAIGLVEDVGVFLALERGLVGAVLLEPVEVLQEEEPRRLLGVIELGGAARLLPEYVVDVLEGLLEHGSSRLSEDQDGIHIIRHARGVRGLSAAEK